MDILTTLTNNTGASVTLSAIGAGIVSINVPDASGCMADVVLGYQDSADYMHDGPCMGKIPGRYANRIAAGRFSLDGHDYSLAVNCGPNHLHGGPDGFHNRIWKMNRVAPDTVEFTYHSADGEEGYPGAVDVVARYTWTDDNVLTLNVKAHADAPTVINLTNHCYFNLAGHSAGSALGHELKLFASRWLPTDPSLVPLGVLDPVAGTPMDFTEAHAIDRDIHSDFPALKYGKGYDNCWAIDGADGSSLRPAAELTDPVSGRMLTVLTTQPGVQVYTGNWLDDSPVGKDGYHYHDYDGVAIECQGFPDAPNQPGFPSQELRPGQEYNHTIVFKFSRV